MLEGRGIAFVLGCQAVSHGAGLNLSLIGTCAGAGAFEVLWFAHQNKNKGGLLPEHGHTSTEIGKKVCRFC